MAAFTIELCNVIELTGGDIGLDDYVIFDEEHRAVLNQRIIDHYWNQEIGTETIAMFRLAMKRRMNEIMPYYNQMYQSQLLTIEPLFTVDVQSESTVNSSSDQTSTSSTTSTATSKSRAVNSDFPQNRLQGDMDYATSGSDSVGESGSTGNGTEGTQAAGEQSSSARTYGTQGSQADMLMRYRETFLNIDLSIIQELSDLFMMIWNTSDDYTGKAFI